MLLTHRKLLQSKAIATGSSIAMISVFIDDSIETTYVFIGDSTETTSDCIGPFTECTPFALDRPLLQHQERRSGRGIYRSGTCLMSAAEFRI